MNRQALTGALRKTRFTTITYSESKMLPWPWLQSQLRWILLKHSQQILLKNISYPHRRLLVKEGFLTSEELLDTALVCRTATPDLVGVNRTGKSRLGWCDRYQFRLDG